MRRRNSDLLPFDLEVNRILKNQRMSNKQELNMDENQCDRNSDAHNEGHSDHNEMSNLREPTFGDCWKSMVNENYSGIRQQFINVNNFELKPSLILMVQQQEFRGHSSEDPNVHLSYFLE